ncbi:uncharacterized protein PSFLO_05715 [Pseudozyma flocculosa]|uniref:Uncharacterized protein n=1 Tax=Pseudozyma flocculosa TaxID=84751 RepID=A0A5C3F6W5_9BASI|nr:uncharacterized protein PSFLO_05715 [Pseudozyma flocculosa]
MPRNPAPDDEAGEQREATDAGGGGVEVSSHKRLLQVAEETDGTLPARRDEGQPSSTSTAGPAEDPGLARARAGSGFSAHVAATACGGADRALRDVLDSSAGRTAHARKQQIQLACLLASRDSERRRATPLVGLAHHRMPFALRYRLTPALAMASDRADAVPWPASISASADCLPGLTSRRQDQA